VKYGTIAEADLHLFRFADDVQTALDLLKDALAAYDLGTEPETPAISETVKLG